MLDVFDVPQGGNNCTRRNASTIALQSLSLLNSNRDGPGHGAAARLENPPATTRQPELRRRSSSPTRARPRRKRPRLRSNLTTQPDNYAGQPDAKEERRDFCQMLLASSAFLYVE